MEYTANRVSELLAGIEWKTGHVLRIFWIRHSNGPRAIFAESLRRIDSGEAIIPLVVRRIGFVNANAVLSDVQEIFDENRVVIEGVKSPAIQRVTVLLLGKDDFRLPQASSPITLPDWFPVLPFQETFFHITDLGLSAEEELLDCPEARIEQVSQLVFELEKAIVDQLSHLMIRDAGILQNFVNAAHGGGSTADCAACVREYREQLELVLNARVYRPNAATGATSLISRLLRLTLNNSPKQLAASAKILAGCFDDSGLTKLKPTFFAAMLRPASIMDGKTASWHAIMLAFYQAYQLMNGAAHAGEYPRYAVALQFANSVNLRIFFVEARAYVEALS